ncbi:MAG: Txe/YoeB family addiction module toxin [Alphaproteobacteria bacterium]|nr:Txe/YoeB family addiction module toxin [Alphaproteobacteria bacterium]
MMYTVVYTKQAQKDALKLKQAGLKEKAQKLLDLLEKTPYHNPPPYEKLVGDLNGFFSRRINIQHRLIYEIIESKKTVKVLRMWSHYEP